MVLGFYSGKIISATLEIVKIVKIDSKNTQQILQICSYAKIVVDSRAVQTN